MVKEENPETSSKTRLKTSINGKRGYFLQSKQNWYQKRYGAIEMKGVIFKKKRPLNQ